MIIVTGGAGFIGSALVRELNNRGITDIIIVDELGNDEKWKNLVNCSYVDYFEKDIFLELLHEGKFNDIEKIFHLGACSDTTETDASFLIFNNYEYTKSLACFAIEKKIKFIYASSAATYGNGDQGYSDNTIEGLRPLNMYGYSKYMFDLWAHKNNILDKIIGLKYFNIFGPNENHKAEMRSLINKAYYQIKETGKLKLFKSYKPEYKDGEQKRDFLYVKDAVKMTVFLADKNAPGGIYNIGSGAANTWNDLAKYIFQAMDLKPKIEYVDMQEHLKNKYQYFTQGNIAKIRDVGYNEPLTLLKDAVSDYVRNYLAVGEYL